MKIKNESPAMRSPVGLSGWPVIASLARRILSITSDPLPPMLLCLSVGLAFSSTFLFQARLKSIFAFVRNVFLPIQTYFYFYSKSLFSD